MRVSLTYHFLNRTPRFASRDGSNPPDSPPNGPSERDSVQLNTTRRGKPSLGSFIEALATQGADGRLVWTSIGSNLESQVNGYPVRLAETSYPDGRVFYKLQIFPKGLFSGFKPPLYNLDAPPSEPVGQQIAGIYQQAVLSLPEIYDSDRGRNRGLRILDILRSRFVLVFPKNAAEARRWASQEDVLFFVKPKSLFYGFNDTTQIPAAELERISSDEMTPEGTFKPVLSEGFVTATGYTPMVHRDAAGQVVKTGMSVEQFDEVLRIAGLPMDRIRVRGQELVQAVRPRNEGA
jgi:hypothetical protein